MFLDVSQVRSQETELPAEKFIIDRKVSLELIRSMRGSFRQGDIQGILSVIGTAHTDVDSSRIPIVPLIVGMDVF